MSRGPALHDKVEPWQGLRRTFAHPHTFLLSRKLIDPAKTLRIGCGPAPIPIPPNRPSAHRLRLLPRRRRPVTHMNRSLSVEPAPESVGLVVAAFDIDCDAEQRAAFVVREPEYDFARWPFTPLDPAHPPGQGVICVAGDDATLRSDFTKPDGVDTVTPSSRTPPAAPTLAAVPSAEHTRSRRSQRARGGGGIGGGTDLGLVARLWSPTFQHSCPRPLPSRRTVPGPLRLGLTCAPRRAAARGHLPAALPDRGGQGGPRRARLLSRRDRALRQVPPSCLWSAEPCHRESMLSSECPHARL